MNTEQSRSTNSELALSWAVSICAFLFPVTLLTLNRADSAMLLVLGIIGIYAALRFGVKKSGLSRNEILLITVFVSWYAVIVLSYFLGDKTDTGFKMLGRNFRFIFIVPAYFACRRYLVKPKFLFVGLVCAPFFILGLAAYQVASKHGFIRASGYVDVIPFGDLSLAIGFMALASTWVLQKSRFVPKYALAGAALLSGIAVSALSETRGGWLALPVLLIVSSVIFSRRSRKRGLKMLALGIVIAAIAGLAVPKTAVYDRVGEAIKSLAVYSDYVSMMGAGAGKYQGCINSRLFTKLLAHQIASSATPDLQVSVVDDSATLAATRFAGECESGYVIDVRNLNSRKSRTFVLRRERTHAAGLQSASFIIEGRGMVSIVHAVSGSEWEKFDNSTYKVIQTKVLTRNLSWPAFWLPAGGHLRFVPIQESPGEYVFPMIDNSVGQRLEMWRAAWQIFIRHPVLGAGTGAFIDKVPDRVRSGDISPSIIGYDHPHNDYLNVLASQGIVGLVFYLLILLYPLYLFRDGLSNPDQFVRSAAFAGILMISGMLVFALTETMFTHSIVISGYVIFVAMLTAIMFGRTSEIRE